MRLSRGVSLLIISAILLVVIGSIILYYTGRTDLPGIDLSHLQRGAIAGHIESLRSQDAPARKKAAAILWQMGTDAKEATPALLEVAKDSDPQVREAAVKALGRTGQGTQDAIPALIEALKDDEAAVRAAAARSLAESWRLGATGRPGAARPPAGRGSPAERPEQPAANGAPGPSPNKLPPAYEGLAQKAVPVLTKDLHDTDEHVRSCAAEALTETGPLAEPAVPDLMLLLQKDTDSSVRLQATLALYNIGPGAKAAVPVLVEKLRSEEADGVRVNTAAALGMIRASPETVVPALVETFLTDKHPDARNCAMKSIGQFGPDAQFAIPLLQKAAKDPKNQQSEATMQNINRLLDYLKKYAQRSGKDRTKNLSPSSQDPSRK
ncbi:MAG: HEAT repeat domain-containing protein [Gemmataceae bacterium]